VTDVALPSGSTETDRFARALALLRGPEITAVDGSLAAEDLRVLGRLLADGRARVLLAVDQAHPGRATEQLSEAEAEYGLPDGSGLPLATRQQRLLAKYRARNAGDRPSLLRTVRTIAAEAQIVSISLDDVGGTDPDAVFRFVILLSEAHWNDTALRATLDQLLAQQVTAHVGWIFTVGAGPGLDAFRAGDPDSLCDRDVLSF
jgi:hypothetical protein